MMPYRKNWKLIPLLLVAFITTINSIGQSPFKKLVWSDEFNTPGLPDSTKWGYDLARGCPQNCGWGNHELQYYTNRPENARVENGHLIITAKKETMEDAQYTSTRMVTKNKGDWKYCRIEVKAKLPAGRGMWPAVWMLPTKWEYGGWPHSGEIDIMENVGYWPDSLIGTVHTGAFNGMKGTQKQKEFPLKICHQHFMYTLSIGQPKPLVFPSTIRCITFLRMNIKEVPNGHSIRNSISY